MTRRLLSNFILFLISTFLLTLCFVIVANAQDAQDRRPAHLGLVYPLSTSGVQAATYENGFSLHLISGVSAGERAFCLSGIAGIVKQNAQGTMISGISNHVGNNMKGAQIAGVFNQTKGKVSGLQLAGIVNSTGGIKGLQLAGLANISNAVSGLQLAGLLNKAENVDNQLGGFINIAKEVKGVQLAGFINIAEESDYPIGLINIIKNGEKQIGISFDESGSTILAFRSGGRFLYGILGIGYNYRYPDARYVIESGLGGHIPLIKDFRANIELTYSALSDIKNDVFVKSTLRTLAAYKFSNHIEIFAGPGINYSGLGDFRSSYEFFSLKGFYLGATGGIQFNL